MSGLLFAGLLVLAALEVQRWAKVHSLDGVSGRLVVEDFLAEPGQSTRLLLTVCNAARRYRPFLSVQLHLAPELIPCGEEHIQKDQFGRGCTARFTAWLHPNQAVTFAVPVRIEHRGRYVLEPLCVGGGDFLGLGETVRRESAFHEILVPPREAEEPALDVKVGGFLGAISVNRYLYDDPILTAGVRPYASGDAMSRISWKQSVRGLGLMVKKPDYTTEPRAVVLVHADAEHGTERVEMCFSMARTVCRILEDRAISYRFIINTEYDLLMNAAQNSGETEQLEAAQGFGPEHFRRVLELLARASGDPAQPAADFLRQKLNLREQYSCILLTTEPEADIRAVLPPMPDSSVLVLTPEQTEEEGTAWI